ncbi:MAG: hypothetical protein R3C14_46135 [Caldilineaceae bacterium]
MTRVPSEREEMSMWERIFSYANMQQALQQVNANRGAAGVDGMTVDELSEHLQKRHMAELDEHLRKRMRQLAWKQWKTCKRRQQRLKQLGVNDYWANWADGASQGPWRMSKSPPLHQALSNQYWRKVGLVSFSQQYQLRRT